MAQTLAATVRPAQGCFSRRNAHKEPITPNLRSQLRVAACRAPQRPLRECRAASASNTDLAQSQVASNELFVLLEKLGDEHSQLEEEELAKRVSEVEEKSAELGFNKASRCFARCLLTCLRPDSLTASGVRRLCPS